MQFLRVEQKAGLVAAIYHGEERGLQQVLRTASARKALRFRPPVQACWADASCIEGIPRMPASARPNILLLGSPAAEGAANARAG